MSISSRSWSADARTIIYEFALRNRRVPPIRARDLAALLFNDSECRQILDAAGLNENGCFADILRFSDSAVTPAQNRFYRITGDFRIELTRV